MPTTQSPFAVANYFIEKSAATGVEITPMKLLKLVYIAHGWSLGLLDRPLIAEQPQAWKYGPVIESLYQGFRRYGNECIPGSATVPHAELNADSLEKQLLDQVWAKYSPLTGGQLSSLTHQPGTPWYKVWHEQGGKDRLNAPIPNALIAQHYKEKAAEIRNKRRNG